MVAAPRVQVIKDVLPRVFSKYRVPGRPVTRCVADDQIRCVPHVRPGVDVASPADSRNYRRPGIRIPDTCQMPDEFVRHLFGFFSWMDGTVTLSPFEVQIEPIDSQPVGTGGGPVHIGEKG